jgi:hypothetical protein
MRGESSTLQKVNDILPTNGVKSLTNVKLEEQCRDLCFVESSGKIFDIEEVVMDASLLDESTLSIRDKLVHEWSKEEGKHLSDDLSNGMD